MRWDAETDAQPRWSTSGWWLGGICHPWRHGGVLPHDSGSLRWGEAQVTPTGEEQGLIFLPHPKLSLNIHLFCADVYAAGFFICFSP